MHLRFHLALLLFWREKMIKKNGETPLHSFSLFLIYIRQLLHAEYKTIISINASWKTVFL